VYWSENKGEWLENARWKHEINLLPLSWGQKNWQWTQHVLAKRSVYIHQTTGHIPEDSDIHSEKKTEHFNNEKCAPFQTSYCTKRVKIVIWDKISVSNTDNAYVLYVRQLNISGDLHKAEQKTPCKNTTTVSLNVKT